MGHQPLDRTMEVGEPEQFERQFIAVVGVAGDIASTHQALEHAILFVRCAAKRLGDLRLAEAFLLPGQQFENVESLVESGRTVSVEFGIAHGSPAESIFSFEPSKLQRPSAAVVDRGRLYDLLVNVNFKYGRTMASFPLVLLSHVFAD